MDAWGPHNPVQFLFLYLWLTELHQLQNISFQAVVFGSGISEDVDKGSRQRNLQGFLDGSDTHLRTVAPTLCDRISHDQWLLENSKFELSFNLIPHLKTTHRMQILHTLRSTGEQEKTEGPHLKL